MSCLRITWAAIMLAILTVCTLWDLVGQTPEEHPTTAAGISTGLPVATYTSTLPPSIGTKVKPPQKSFSANWAGAVNSSPLSGRFAAAKMKVTLPAALYPDVIQPQTDYYAVNTWVSIDASYRHTAFLQTGVTMEVNKTVSNELIFRPWYRWWPKEAMSLDVPLRPGDEIEMEAVMFNETSGKIFFENISQGEWVSRKLKAPQLDAALAGRAVEWIVEDFELATGGNAPFGNFGTLNLTDCIAYTSNNDVIVPDPSQTLWIHQDKAIRARSKVNGSLVTVEYVQSS